MSLQIKSLDKHNAALLDRVNGMGKLRTHLEVGVWELETVHLCTPLRGMESSCPSALTSDGRTSSAHLA